MPGLLHDGGALLVIRGPVGTSSDDGLTRQHLCSGGAHIPDPITGVEQETKSELSTMKGKAKKQMKGTQPSLGDQRKFLERSPKG